MAEASGLLHEGDEILEVNEVDLRGKNVNEVCTHSKIPFISMSHYMSSYIIIANELKDLIFYFSLGMRYSG